MIPVPATSANCHANLLGCRRPGFTVVQSMTPTQQRRARLCGFLTTASGPLLHEMGASHAALLGSELGQVLALWQRGKLDGLIIPLPDEPTGPASRVPLH